MNKEKFLEYLEAPYEHCVKEFNRCWKHGSFPDPLAEAYYASAKEILSEIQESVKSGKFDDEKIS